MKETELQNLVCQYLELRKYFFWRQNTAPTVQKDGDKWHFRRMPRYSLKGVADILVILPPHGTMCAIELKSGKYSYQSKEQKEFQKRLEKVGGVYILCRDLKDVEEIL